MKRSVLAAVALAVATAPATASAASIEVAATPTGSSVIAYKALPGEVNALHMSGTVGGPFDLRMRFTEFSAPLATGPGCAGSPAICGDVGIAYPVQVALGDKNDVTSVNSLTGVVGADAGSGNDDLFAGGIDATADGGSGNDTMVLAANNLTTASGGSGRDKLHGGLGAAAAILDGGDGADLLVPGGFAFGDANGGAGADQLVSFSGDVLRLDGSSGADVIAVPTGGADISLTGGSGGDIVSTPVGGTDVDAGSGDDLVIVQSGTDAAGDSVICGPGFDVAFYDSAADTVSRDCELRFKTRAPSVRDVTEAIAAARALIAHRPDPSTA